MSDTYHSHYRPRKALEKNNEIVCVCSCPIGNASERLCQTCIDSTEIMESASKSKLIDTIIEKVLPIQCDKCCSPFADKLTLNNHIQTNCKTEAEILKSSHKNILVPKKMTVDELKKALKMRKMSATGTKAELQKRLEGRLTIEE